MVRVFSSLIAFLLLVVTHLNASDTDFSLKRKRGTFVKGYYTHVGSEKEAPLIVFIDGSSSSSVYENHTKLASKFAERGFSFVSIEKEGVTKDSFDESIFTKYDCFENRYSDHVLLFQEIKKGEVIKKPSHLIILGASEGGKLAPSLALTFEEWVDGLLLISCGGGLPFSEEMTFQINEALNKQNFVAKAGSKIRKAFLPKEIESQMKKILKNPDSPKVFAHKAYKWWSSYLNYNPLDDLLKLDIPIFMIHGAKDDMVPVKSADIVVDSFNKAEKKNLKYGRYLDLSHSLKDRDDVYSDILSWAENIVSKKK